MTSTPTPKAPEAPAGSSPVGGDAWRKRVRLQTKYSNPNPIARRLTQGFLDTLRGFSAQALAGLDAGDLVLEAGCGEGINLAMLEALPGAADKRLVGFDIDDPSLENARHLVTRSEVTKGDIYAIAQPDASCGLVLCCEVLEHLDDPARALRELHRVARGPVILSVPREPVWCMLNMARGKYWGSLGNTPGHLNHWTRGGFVRFVSTVFDVREVKSPLPWTMLLAHKRG